MNQRATAAAFGILLLGAHLMAAPPSTSKGGPESREKTATETKQFKGPLAERPQWVVNINYIDCWLDGRRRLSKFAQATIILMGDEAVASYSWDGKTYVDSMTWVKSVMVGTDGGWVYLSSDRSFGLVIATSGKVYYTFDGGKSCAPWPGRRTKNEIDRLTKAKPPRPADKKKPEPGKIDDIDDPLAAPGRPRRGTAAQGDNEPEAVKKYRDKYKPSPRP